MTTEKCDQGEGTEWGFCRPFMCSVIHHPSITKLDSMAHSSFLSSPQDPRPSCFDAQLYPLQRGSAATPSLWDSREAELRAQEPKARLSRPPPESASSMSTTSGFLIAKVPKPEPRPLYLTLLHFPHPPDHGFTKSFMLQASPLSVPTF